jgi:hypothetical protein
MAIEYIGSDYLECLSTDTKPTNLPNGFQAKETNTEKKFVWNSTVSLWIPQEITNYLKYRVLKIGTTYYIIDQHGKHVGSGTDCQVVLQAAIDGMPNPGILEFTFDTGLYTINNPIIIPSVLGASAQKRVIFKGIPWSRRGGTDRHVTQFTIPATWPTNRYVFECNNAPGSNTLSFLEMDGLYVTAVDAFTTKNVGLVKFQADDIANLSFFMDRITGQYMWRGIHLLGGVWRGVVRNCDLDENNTGYIGDADIILEWGGATGPSGPMPKQMAFENIRIAHGDGQVNNHVQIKGGAYNYFNNIEVDGYKCVEAVYNLDATDYVTNTAYPVASNLFVNPWTLDFVGTPAPDNRKGSIYLNGTGCFDNRFINGKLSKIINTVKVAGGALRNRIEMTGVWGGVSTVDSTGAGTSNILEVTGGHGAAADAVIVDTAGNFRIIDYRRGATNGGTSTQSGNGTTKAFNIAHGLLTTPVKFRADNTSDDAIGPYKTTATSTNIVVTYPLAPVSGSSNLSWVWSAEAYK